MLSGGQAIELAASKSTNPEVFLFPTVMPHYRDCNFSVAGLKNTVRKHILQQEKLHGTVQWEPVLEEMTLPKFGFSNCSCNFDFF